MPTKSERQALAFFATIALLGAGVRMLTSDTPPAPTAHERAELENQIAATDSAAESGRKGKPKRPRKPKGKQQPDSAEGSRERPAGPQQFAPLPIADRGPRPSDLPVDVDQAGEKDLERLPFIGPALAARIIADREAHGPFGSIEALQRVRGIGPATAARLAPRVTFSGSPRPRSVPPAGAVLRPGEHPWAPGGNSSRPW